MKHSFSCIIALTGLIFCLSSCHTAAPRLDYKALAQASVRLGMDIGLTDNHKLYLNAAEWIGTPYRAGGDSKHGTDCSGLVSQLYKKTYRIRLSRSTDGQLKESNRIARRNLREGDLVFFVTQESGTCRHLPERRQVRSCQYRTRSHREQPQGRLLYKALALRRKSEIRLHPTLKRGYAVLAHPFFGHNFCD